jgi:hypothetical protein
MHQRSRTGIWARYDGMFRTPFETVSNSAPSAAARSRGSKYDVGGIGKL